MQAVLFSSKNPSLQAQEDPSLESCTQVSQLLVVPEQVAQN